MFDSSQNGLPIFIARRCVGLIGLVVLLTATTAVAEVDNSPVANPVNLQTFLDDDYDGDRVSSPRGVISLGDRGCKVRHCCDSARALRQRRLYEGRSTTSFNVADLLTKPPIGCLSTVTADSKRTGMLGFSNLEWNLTAVHDFEWVKTNGGQVSWQHSDRHEVTQVGGNSERKKVSRTV